MSWETVLGSITLSMPMLAVDEKKVVAWTRMALLKKIHPTFRTALWRLTLEIDGRNAVGGSVVGDCRR